MAQSYLRLYKSIQGFTTVEPHSTALKWLLCWWLSAAAGGRSASLTITRPPSTWSKGEEGAGKLWEGMDPASMAHTNGMHQILSIFKDSLPPLSPQIYASKIAGTALKRPIAEKEAYKAGRRF